MERFGNQKIACPYGCAVLSFGSCLLGLRVQIPPTSLWSHGEEEKEKGTRT
jgi:hypothetical protein